MYNLHHFALCPNSRMIRILLAEKQLVFKLIDEKPWMGLENVSIINPAMELPILTMDNHSISSVYAICEYLEVIDQDCSFLSSSHFINAEIRRLVDWYARLFYRDVSKPLIDEKVILHYASNNAPRTNILRAIRNNLLYHLDYLEYILHTRKWVAGNIISLADFAAAAQISVIDYLGEMEWEKHSLVKEWYSVLKSRPSFRSILADKITGFTPPLHYQNLDF